MDIPGPLITVFPPSADLLLDLARRQVDDAMLMEIAGADYGSNMDAHLAQLRPILHKRMLPAPMQWYPEEVLRLVSFSNPEQPNPPPHEPGPTGHRGHQMRMFACATLLRAAADPKNSERSLADDATLAQALVSAKMLGEEMSEAAARFLTWRIPGMLDDDDPVLFALGLLILAARLRPGRITDSVLGDAAEWVLREEARSRQMYAPGDAADPRPYAFGIQQGFWKPLAAELLSDAADINTDHVRDNLRLCELLLE